MSKRRTALSLTAPVIAAAKTAARPGVSPTGRRKEAGKAALLALEQSLRLQSYTIRLSRSRPLFSGNDTRRPTFCSVPLHVIRLNNGK